MMMTVSSERGEQSFPACLFIHMQINRQRKTTPPAVVLLSLKMSFLHFLQKHNIFFLFRVNVESSIFSQRVCHSYFRRRTASDDL